MKLGYCTKLCKMLSIFFALEDLLLFIFYCANCDSWFGSISDLRFYPRH